MITPENDANTFFAPPDRDPDDVVFKIAEQLKEEFLLPWFDAVPVSILVVNHHRQIVYTNEAFQVLAAKIKVDDVIGLRPGEALDCVHSRLMRGGCGTSVYCTVCGAAQAIVKSLSGEADCQECRLLRLIEGSEVPLDLQVFAKPITFRDSPFTLLFIMDISHELRLRYLNRSFYHGLINAVGGVSSLASLLETQSDPELPPLVAQSSQRILRDVLYHRDIDAAEQGSLHTETAPIDMKPFLHTLVAEECEARSLDPSGVRLTVTCDTVTSDKRLLSHVVRNLLRNALEATEEHGGTVGVRCVEENGKPLISVSNSGSIPTNIRLQLFKRYVSSKHPDRGMGTYMVKLLVERYLGGTVACAPGDDPVRFTVTLPRG